MQPEKIGAQRVLVAQETPEDYKDQKQKFLWFYAIRSPMIRRHQKSQALKIRATKVNNANRISHMYLL